MFSAWILCKIIVLALVLIQSIICFQAISVKETQLIQNIASDVDIGSQDASSMVRIVSPKDEDIGNKNEDDDLEWKTMKYGADQLLQVDTEGQADQQILDCVDNQDFWNVADKPDIIYSLKGISSYEDFIEHLDQQLNKIETELVMVLRVSTLLLEKNEKPKNYKVKQTEELLEGVRTIRERYTLLKSVQCVYYYLRMILRQLALSCIPASLSVIIRSDICRISSIMQQDVGMR